MISWIKSRFASFVSAEVATEKKRYNKKCAECRDLIGRSAESDRLQEDYQRRIAALKDIISRHETEVEQYELLVEELENKATLTDQVVKQQQFMIQRDLENRRLELLTAKLQVSTAHATINGVPGSEVKDDQDYADNESDVNYRRGR
jgi:chromosome segregation ATPase